jgi:hypothetical protein
VTLPPDSDLRHYAYCVTTQPDPVSRHYAYSVTTIPPAQSPKPPPSHDRLNKPPPASNQSLDDRPMLMPSLRHPHGYDRHRKTKVATASVAATLSVPIATTWLRPTQPPLIPTCASAPTVLLVLEHPPIPVKKVENTSCVLGERVAIIRVWAPVGFRDFLASAAPGTRA